MADTSITFQIPKQNLLKLNSTFDLQNIANDTYYLKLLTDVSGLSMDTISGVTSLSGSEADPTTYDKVRVNLNLQEETNGYSVKFTDPSINIALVGLDELIIKGICIVLEKNNQMYVFCADLGIGTVKIGNNQTINFTGDLLRIGDTCPVLG